MVLTTGSHTPQVPPLGIEKMRKKAYLAGGDLFFGARDLPHPAARCLFIFYLLKDTALLRFSHRHFTQLQTLWATEE